MRDCKTGGARQNTSPVKPWMLRLAALLPDRSMGLYAACRALRHHEPALLRRLAWSSVRAAAASAESAAFARAWPILPSPTLVIPSSSLAPPTSSSLTRECPKLPLEVERDAVGQKTLTGDAGHKKSSGCGMMWQTSADRAGCATPDKRITADRGGGRKSPGTRARLASSWWPFPFSEPPSPSRQQRRYCRCHSRSCAKRRRRARCLQPGWLSISQADVGPTARQPASVARGPLRLTINLVQSPWGKRTKHPQKGKPARVTKSHETAKQETQKQTLPKLFISPCLTVLLAVPGVIPPSRSEDACVLWLCTCCARRDGCADVLVAAGGGVCRLPLD